jgi:PPOX class probable FMN-dependent enzyme
VATAEISPGITAEITTVAELEAVVGTPLEPVAEKVRPSLDAIDRLWLEHSPLCLIGTSDAEGNLDVSPKGDPAGRLAHVIDAHTLAIAERPGNRRVDGYRNILTNPHVGLIFLVPGRGDTLRVNGRARLLRAAPYFDELVVKGHRPILALEVAIDEVFYHCASPRRGTTRRSRRPRASRRPSSTRTSRSRSSRSTTGPRTRRSSTGPERRAPRPRAPR